MSSYTANIPQPGDDPSDSQDQILQNFQTLQNIYGTSGDHYPWTNTTPIEGFKHAKVTLPGLPTANVPGNLMPTPQGGNCAIFGITRNSQTTPFVARDGIASPTPPDFVNLWPLLPIKAFASITLTGADGAQTISSSFNITSCNQTTLGQNRTYTFTITNALRTNTYGIIPAISTGADDLRFARDGGSPTTIFTVIAPTGPSTPAGAVLNVIIIEP